MYVCIPFDDVSAMWEQSVQGLLLWALFCWMEPGISPYSNGAACLPNLPKTTPISPTAPLCCTTYASPYLDSLSGSLRRFRPQGFFFILPCWAQYCPIWRTAFELGDAEFPLSAKKKN